MSHIAVSHNAVKPQETRGFLTRILHRCMSLLPFLRLPGYSPMPPWDLVNPHPEETAAETLPADTDKPPSG